MCGHEWAAGGQPDEHPPDGAQVIRDAVGNPLADGDTVTLVKTVKAVSYTHLDVYKRQP